MKFFFQGLMPPFVRQMLAQPTKHAHGIHKTYVQEEKIDNIFLKNSNFLQINITPHNNYNNFGHESPLFSLRY